MVPEDRIPTHPGEILLEEFLKPLGISQTALAEHLRINVQDINLIVNQKRSISARMAWLLSEAFKTSPEFWTNLQAAHDLAQSRPTRHVHPIA